jgi:hypothetical protein
MSRFNLYRSDLLPDGFVYPEELQMFAQTGEYPAIYPWWFVDALSEAGQLFYQLRQHDGRNLVPFAKVDDGRGDIACFDGDDLSGNPRIAMLILDGSGRHYSYRDFDAWLGAAKLDAQSF